MAHHDQLPNLGPSSVGHVPPHFEHLESASVTHSTSSARFGALTWALVHANRLVQPKSGAATQNRHKEVQVKCETSSPNHPIAWHRLGSMCGRGVGMVASRLASLHTPHDGVACDMVRMGNCDAWRTMINSHVLASHRLGMCRAISDIYKALP